jgi:hypothetical protein
MTTQTQNKRTQTSILQVGFESTTPVFERAKTDHALDRTVTVIGPSHFLSTKISLSVRIMFHYILLYLIVPSVKVFITALCVIYIATCIEVNAINKTGSSSDEDLLALGYTHS